MVCISFLSNVVVCVVVCCMASFKQTFIRIIFIFQQVLNEMILPLNSRNLLLPVWEIPRLVGEKRDQQAEHFLN